MQKLIQAAILLALAGTAAAQVTKVEKYNPSNPPEADAKPNSDKVPDVMAIPSQFERVLVLRFKHQAELLAGLESMVKEHKIKNGVILSAVGSVRNYHVHSVHNRTFPSLNIYIKDPTAPADTSSPSPS
jgi:hypothetical protein